MENECCFLYMNPDLFLLLFIFQPYIIILDALMLFVFQVSIFIVKLFYCSNSNRNGVNSIKIFHFHFSFEFPPVEKYNTILLFFSIRCFYLHTSEGTIQIPALSTLMGYGINLVFVAFFCTFLRCELCFFLCFVIFLELKRLMKRICFCFLWYLETMYDSNAPIFQHSGFFLSFF